MERQRKWPALWAWSCTVLLFANTAFAQLGGLQVIVAPDGVTVEGSLTVDGVTWTGAEVLQLARDAAADSRNITTELPPPVQIAVAEAMAALRARAVAP
jgi:hypothetical protein